MAGPSADDLEEIAEGKASSRDKAEAGIRSAAAARRMLSRRHGVKVHTSIKRRKKRSY